MKIEQTIISYHIFKLEFTKTTKEVNGKLETGFTLLFGDRELFIKGNTKYESYLEYLNNYEKYNKYLTELI